MKTIASHASFVWERRYPEFFGAIGLAAGYFFLPNFMLLLHEKNFVTENLFVAVFTLGTVAAGFGLTIYTFVLTAETGFIGRAKRSSYFRSMIMYLLVAIGLSFLLSIFSVPGMIIKEKVQPHSVLSIYYAFWLCLTAWSGAAVYRAAYVFSIFSREHH